jgi:hypothetical protein
MKRFGISMGLVALAATAVAFAVGPMTPALATTYTQPTGSKLSSGSLFKGTGVGGALVTNLSGESLMACTASELTGEVVNAGGPGLIASMNITGFSFGGTGANGDCTGASGASIKWTFSIAGGLPWCIKTLEGKDEFEGRGGKCNEASRSIKFTTDATGIGSCGYETARWSGSFTTDTTSGDAVLQWSKAGPIRRFESEGLVSLLCPTESTIDMAFTLERDESTSSPIYIS